MNNAHVISWMNVDYSDTDWVYNPESQLFDHRLLAEGDSWFTLGGMPTSNLLFSMRFPDSVVIVNCGYPGDTIKNMAQIASNQDLRDAMNVHFGSAWDAILLSGGGNDIIDNASRIIQSAPGAPADPAAYCNQAVLDAVLQDIEQGYRRIVALRDAADSSCPDAPVVVHTYDWVTPRDAPAHFIMVPVLGPWLYPALTDAAVPQNRWLAVSDYLLGRLRDTIKKLAQGPNRLPNFHVVVTQGTLQRAALDTTLESGDWMNEIHPSFGGYRKLATKIARKVRQVI